jgi:hypothetical protein
MQNWSVATSWDHLRLGSYHNSTDWCQWIENKLVEENANQSVHMFAVICRLQSSAILSWRHSCQIVVATHTCALSTASGRQAAAARTRLGLARIQYSRLSMKDLWINKQSFTENQHRQMIAWSCLTLNFPEFERCLHSRICFAWTHHLNPEGVPHLLIAGKTPEPTWRC